MAEETGVKLKRLMVQLDNLSRSIDALDGIERWAKAATTGPGGLILRELDRVIAAASLTSEQLRNERDATLTEFHRTCFAIDLAEKRT